MFFSILWTLICGSFIGWLAGKLMHRHTSLVRNIIVGIVGSALGNFLFSLIGFHATRAFQLSRLRRGRVSCSGRRSGCRPQQMTPLPPCSSS